MSYADISPDLELAPAGQQEIYIRRGDALPFGATVLPDGSGVNFSIASRYATDCALVLFKRGAPEPFAEISFPDEFKIGSVFAMQVIGVDWRDVEYGYRMDGPYDPENGHRFDYSKILLDPYAKFIGGREVWGQQIDPDNIYQHRGRIVTTDFEWHSARPLQTPIEDLIIYEMHVRGFTRHASSNVTNRGTYDGMRQRIGYLKALGVNCVELLPVFEYDEFENSRTNFDTGEVLVNYWGYSPVGFFAPKAGYAAAADDLAKINELKWLIKELHENGIEVILDVVFNHTAEGNERGGTISFKGIDNKTFYILTPGGYYYNFSGTGNTFNCNQPAAMELIIDCLRYWVMEYHIDGFRFDLASVMARDEDGTPLANPPILKAIAHDPIVGNCKLIAEPWDADGLYHVGSFPAYGRWAEWNGKFRDAARRFLKGEQGQALAMAQRIQGSPDLYAGRGPISSINFITAHDGFSLLDMVTYNEKYNINNLEDNRDGANNNHSWNCGIEGPTEDVEINALRRRQIKNAACILLLSHGIPMIRMGDEIGFSQQGNNNTYCQDNELSWFDWSLIETNADILRFFKNMITFRKWHPILRNGHFLREKDITWHGLEVGKPDWSMDSLVLAYKLDGRGAKGGLFTDNDLYVAMNMHWEEQTFALPKPPKGKLWHQFVDTGMLPPDEITEPGQEHWLENQKQITLVSHSIVILVAK